MKKIYVACSFAYEDKSKREKVEQEIDHIVSFIESAYPNLYDICVPHRYKVEHAWDLPLEVWAQDVFEYDMKELEDSNIVLFISFGKENNDGAAFEVGYAHSKKKKIIMIKMNDEVESAMIFPSADVILYREEIEKYDWKNLPPHKSKLKRIS